MAFNGKFIEKSGFIGVKDTITSVITDLLASGFEQIYPVAAFNASSDTKVVLKPSADVDPLVTTQPWAIKFEWTNPADTDGLCDVYVATPAQFDAEGNHNIFRLNPNDATKTEASGILGTINKDYLGTDGQPPMVIQNYPEMKIPHDPLTKTFLHRLRHKKSELPSFPLSYRIGVAPRGLYLSVWDETADDTGNRMSWFVVQRPVHAIPTTLGSTVIQAGKMVDTGKCPVHCIYGMSGLNENKVWYDEEYYRTFTGFPWQIVMAAAKTDLSDAEALKTFMNKIVIGGSFTGVASTDLDKIPHSTDPDDAYTKSITSSLAWNGMRDAFRSIPKAKQYCLNRFVVREKDITSPYPQPQFIKELIASESEGQPAFDYIEYGQPFGVPADQHSTDYAAVINTKQQVSISENNRYIINFPNGMNTSRYSYTHEMDLIAYASADVVGDGTEVAVSVYGEPEPRIYVGGKSNGPNNTGVRILFLKSGGGILE